MVRRRWRRFRQRFDDLRMKPLLNYAWYSRGKEGIFRFIGGFESVTDGHTLWLRSDDLTIPVSLSRAETYVLPISEKDGISNYFDPDTEAPVKIRWHQITALTEGARVFVGGLLQEQENRLTFVSRKDTPLVVIFYNGPDRALTQRTIRAGRHGNEYWNIITPYALILGVFSQILIALNYLQRPAYRLTVLCALAAVFIPLFPLIPPGFLLTILYRRLWQQARVYRVYRDLVLLPLKYLSGNTQRGVLPNGEVYGWVYVPSSDPEFRRALEALPLLIPQNAARSLIFHRSDRPPQDGWYLFGVFSGPDHRLPQEPADLFATYGAIPGKPERLARRFTIGAYTLEIISWVLLLTGIGINTFFIGMIILFLG